MVKLSEMFEDHMVLQRGMPVPVWGQAEAGGCVTVSIAGKTARAHSEDGAFRVTLPALPMGGPYDLIAETATERVALRDVYVGEVWLAGGQSNMEMPLFAARGARRLVEAQRFPLLRLKTISRKSYDSGLQYGFHFMPESSTPQPWRIADGESAALFSAIGYAFGHALSEREQIPVGIISCNWGGTKVQPWVSREALLREPVFRGDIEAFEEIRAALGERAGRAQASFEEGIRRIMAEHPAGDVVRRSLDDPLYYWRLDAGLPWPPDGATGDPNEPGCLYTHMLRRVFPFAMRGVLWYQGESSAQAEDVHRYEPELRAMICDWRRADENDRLVFLLSQLAPYDTSRRAYPCDWMQIREQQRRLARSCPAVYLACIPDLGEANNIHPTHKIEVGLRLDALAREAVYGDGVCGQGPVAECAARTGAGVAVAFSHAEGLRINHALPIELSEDGVSFMPADRVELLSPATLLCACDALAAPRFVRYAWRPMMDDGLRNAQNLPAGPFVLEIQDCLSSQRGDDADVHV